MLLDSLDHAIGFLSDMILSVLTYILDVSWASGWNS